MPIDPLPSPPPTRQDPENFAARGDAFMAALPPFALQTEAARQQIVQVGIDAAQAADNAAASEQIASGAANYQGEYDAGTSYAKGDAVSYQGDRYVAKQSTTGNLPTNTTYWLRIIAIPGMAGEAGKFLTNDGAQPAWGEPQTLPVGGIGWFARNDLTFDWRGMKFVRSGAVVTPDLAPSWPPPGNVLPPLFRRSPVATNANTISLLETDRDGNWLVKGTSFFQKSTNNGVSFSATGSFSGDDIATDRAGVWITCLFNEFWRTTDLFATSSNISNGGLTLNIIETDRSGVWVASGSTSTSGLRSTDNGLTWSAITTVRSVANADKAIATDCNGYWLLISNAAGVLARSSDNGASWSAMPAISGAGVLVSVATNETGTWIASDGVRTWRSTNVGTTWTTRAAQNIRSIRHMSGSNWVGIGSVGGVDVIWFSADDGMSWVAQHTISTGTLKSVRTDGTKILIMTATPHTISTIETGLVGIRNATEFQYLRYD